VSANDKAIVWAGFMRTGIKSPVIWLPRPHGSPHPLDEAFSLVPVESLACGTPVAASNKGGTPEIVKPGKTGYLLEHGTVKEIQDLILSLDKKELHKMGQTGREVVLRNHSIHSWGKQHEVIYHELLDSPDKG